MFSSKFSRKILGVTLLELLLLLFTICIVVGCVIFFALKFMTFGGGTSEQETSGQKLGHAKLIVDAPIIRTEQVVISLSNELVKTARLNKDFLFSFNKKLKVATEWPIGKSGFLVKSYDGINVELLGYSYLKANGQFANSGEAALVDLDINFDKKLDKLDSDFDHLFVWVDRNRNGAVDQKELISLQYLGIETINLQNIVSINEHINQSIATHQGQFIQKDGKVGRFYIIDLFQNPYYREFLNKLPISFEAKELPNVRGFGNVRDLREAVTLNPRLFSLVVEYFSTELADERFSQIGNIIFEWSKTEQQQYLVNRLASVSTPKFDIRLVEDINFNRYTKQDDSIQSILNEIMVIERFTTKTQLSFFTKEVLNRTSQNWELHLIASFGKDVVMNRVISANTDGSKRKILLSADMFKFSPEQIEDVHQRYEKIKKDVFNEFQLQGNLRQHLQEQISTGRYFWGNSDKEDLPYKRHISKCLKPGKIIDEQVKDCAEGKIPKTW